MQILDTAADVFASAGLRASIQDVAAAAGLWPGSLYHHFESKEAIVVELIQRYHDDLDRLAGTVHATLDDADSGSILEQIMKLASAIADCGVRNRAALQLTFYEAPAGADAELLALTRRPAKAIQAAMLDLLRAGRWAGEIRADIDLAVLSDRICQSMLHVGLGLFRQHTATGPVATVLCRILLYGLAAARPDDETLDRSVAMAAAESSIEAWQDDPPVIGNEKYPRILAAARSEFGRKGYEATTTRDIAAAAGVGLGTVHRLLGSKEEILRAVMESFGKKVVAPWISILGCQASVVEKLDALMWIDINVVDRFPDEFKIQLAWLRQSPPDAQNMGWSFTTRVRQLKTLLLDGLRSGQIGVDSPSAETLARCVLDLLWVPENIVAELGRRPALTHARDTVLRGVTNREPGPAR